MDNALKAFGSIALQENHGDTVILLHSNVIPITKAEKNNSLWTSSRFTVTESKRYFLFFLRTLLACSSGQFDVNKTKSETGKSCPYLFPGSIRSLDPIYSHVFIGPLSKDLCTAKGETTFGKGSIFEKIERLNTYVGVLNVGWEYGTIFHRYEELARVPYRYFKTFEGQCKGYDGKNIHTKAEMYVRDLYINAENDMRLAIPQLREESSFKKLTDHANELEFVNLNDLRKVATKMLKNDPWSLLANKNSAKLRNYHVQAKKNSPSYNIALIGPGM